jgi:nondiscriminating glutamyl-tRNA synthetase
MAEVVTRFAPSPTGYLHGGNYRTAVFAYLFAKKMDGKFIVRIEDTDTARSKKEYEDNIIESLHWLKLEWDVMYRQSDNTNRYKELLEKLIAEGKAYVSKEEVKEEGGRSEVIRFKNPKKVVTFSDAIRGEISMDTTDLGDFVIARSITEPVFHFAVVVDDHDEDVTHVIRGEDHISNTPRQMLIAEALGFTSPSYAHLPLVLGTDRTKLSKRRGAKALTEYRDQGYLPEAMLNYLALLGWHPDNEQEIFTVEELVQAFTLERIQKSSGIFDEVKLKWFNHEHLKRLSSEAFLSRLEAYIKDRGGEVPLYLAKAAPMLKERAQTLGEAWEALKAGEFDFFGEAFKGPSSALLLQGAKAEKDAVIGHFKQLESLLGGLSDEAFTPEGVKNAVFPYATEVGRASVLWPMRVALSGKEKSPDPFTLAAALGKTVTLLRIAAASRGL